MDPMGRKFTSRLDARNSKVIGRADRCGRARDRNLCGDSETSIQGVCNMQHKEKKIQPIVLAMAVVVMMSLGSIAPAAIVGLPDIDITSLGHSHFGDPFFGSF